MTIERCMSVARWGSTAAVRALAIFALANVALGLASPAWNANELWIQAGVLPAWLVQILVVTFASGVLLLHRPSATIHRILRSLGLLLGLACLTDAVAFYRLLGQGRITSALPVPLSLLLGLLLLVWALLPSRRPRAPHARSRRALLLRVLAQGAPLALLAFGVLLHITTFGATDYARPADAAVVFGAAVRASGKPSQALTDRTVTACDLYHRGLVQHLVLSGGRDPRAPLSEPAAMARIAIAHGVPAAALVLDEEGINTAGSIRGAQRLMHSHGWTRLLMVSHDYHLARIKLSCRRAGLDALTVPAHEGRRLLLKPWFVAREVLALAWYYIHPVRRPIRY